MSQRNIDVDVLKGIGIILMILGHCSLTYAFKKGIFLFHMPLFFLVSGFLYKDKSLRIIVSRNLKKIIFPYIITGCVIWIGKCLQGDYDWGISLLLANGSRTVLNSSALKEYSVGPLWYLMAYFVAMFFFYYISQWRNKKCIAILIILFEFSIIFVHFLGLLPFDIFPAVAACVFLFAGLYYRNNQSKVDGFLRKWYSLVIGIAVSLLCVWKGGLSMASHIYTLNILQIISASFVLWLLFKLIVHARKVMLMNINTWGGWIGKNSLLIMCIHSIDYNLGHPTFMQMLLTNENIPNNVLIQFVSMSLFIVLISFLIVKIPFIRNIFSVI